MCFNKERRKEKKNILTPELDISCNAVKNIIRKVHNSKQKLYIYFENNRMPKGGWMQSCFSCSIFTARTIIFNEDKDKEYIVYICNNCKKTLINSDINIKFKEKCIKFINKFY